MDIKLTELAITSVYKSDDLATVAVALAGTRNPYQLRELAEALLRAGKEPATATGLQASYDITADKGYTQHGDSDEDTHDHASISTTQLEARLGRLSFKFSKVYDVERDIQATRRNRITLADLRASGGEIVQEDFDFDSAGTVQFLQAGGVVEYDYDEAAEVLDSLGDGHALTIGRLFAAGSLTPKKLVGDLAQTSILTSSGQEQVLGLSEWSIDWKRKTVEATTTDDAAYESSLGSTKSWTAKAKLMFIDGDQSQVDAVLAVIDTLFLDPQTWNFFPTVESGRTAFQGAAIIDGLSITTGMGKLLALDVSLKGTGPLKRLAQAAPVANPNTVTGQTAQV